MPVLPAQLSEAIVAHARALNAVPKADVEFGDLILVTTGHSTYSIYVLKGGQYAPGTLIGQMVSHYRVLEKLALRPALQALVVRPRREWGTFEV